MATQDELNAEKQRIMAEQAPPTPPPPAAPPQPRGAAELGVSLNFKLDGRTVRDVQITMRGVSHNDADEVMAHFKAMFEAHNWNFAEARQAAPPPATSAVQAAQEVGKGNAAPAPVAPQAAPVAPAQSGPLTMSIVKLSMLPKPDGKCQVSFFESGHKFPDIYSTKKVEDWVKFMAPTGGWTAEHFAAVAEYDVAVVVTYTLSEKLNTKGNRYKDLASVKLA